MYHGNLNEPNYPAEKAERLAHKESFEDGNLQDDESNRLDLQVSLGVSQPVQIADIEKQEQLLTLLYEFADKQLYKKGNKITHKGFKEAEDKFRDIYSVGDYLKKIMDLFGYKITPIE